jgi:hypothetical protein
LQGTFSYQATRRASAAGFSEKDIKVVSLDSVRGLTAEYVHVIRARRTPDKADQYCGIQGDLRREYISYTRGRQKTSIWLEREPFGTPDDKVQQFKLSDPNSKGQDHANLRNRLIKEQKLPFSVIEGELWQDLEPLQKADERLSLGIYDGFRLINKSANVSTNLGTNLGTNRIDAFSNALDAIKGLCGPLSDFLRADLAAIRSNGILRAPAPMKLFDADMNDQGSYPPAAAVCLAMAIAPAVVATVDVSTELVQLAIPLVNCFGVHRLGCSTNQEPLLRAFILVVRDVHVAITDLRLTPRAVLHKAESVDIDGQRWYSKACRSDREACVLLQEDLARRKRRRVYAYLGGGSLTHASTDLAQAMVVRTKDWAAAASVLAAVWLLTSCVPGIPVMFQQSYVIAGDGDAACVALETDEADAEPVAAGLPDVKASFAETCQKAAQAAATRLLPSALAQIRDRDEALVTWADARLRWRELQEKLAHIAEALAA